ncbi:MAG TPA: hypothetical protein VKZ49_16420 [Polyangiaceae bacterium]|nr:hypothetical protein [Polyangiaceae bacterium]
MDQLAARPRASVEKVEALARRLADQHVENARRKAERRVKAGKRRPSLGQGEGPASVDAIVTQRQDAANEPYRHALRQMHEEINAEDNATCPDPEEDLADLAETWARLAVRSGRPEDAAVTWAIAAASDAHAFRDEQTLRELEEVARRFYARTKADRRAPLARDLREAAEILLRVYVRAEARHNATVKVIAGLLVARAEHLHPEISIYRDGVDVADRVNRTARVIRRAQSRKVDRRAPDEHRARAEQVIRAVLSDWGIRHSAIKRLFERR